MNCVFIDIPNELFAKVVAPYAFLIGRPVRNVVEMETALINYSHMASKLN